MTGYEHLLSGTITAIGYVRKESEFSAETITDRRPPFDVIGGGENLFHENFRSNMFTGKNRPLKTCVLELGQETDAIAIRENEKMKKKNEKNSAWKPKKVNSVVCE